MVVLVVTWWFGCFHVHIVPCLSVSSRSSTWSHGVALTGYLPAQLRGGLYVLFSVIVENYLGSRTSLPQLELGRVAW